MPDQVVYAPASLLLSRTLPPSARLVWLVARLMPAAPAPSAAAWLEAASGLARNTVRSGLAQLAAQGWEPPPLAPDRTVPMPAALLTNRSLSAMARVVYGILLLTPGFSHPSGRFAYAELADLAHVSPNTLAGALTELVRAEWITVERKNRKVPVSFELTFPGRERGEVALAAAQERLSKHRPSKERPDQQDISYGELLMREYLNLLIDSDVYADSAHPGFLLNPRTKELLQFDRYYPPAVGFEFQGPQHFRATNRFTPKQSAAQRERDLIKIGICAERGITLVTVLAEDLTLERMRQKVPRLLALRDLTGYEQLIDYLELESRSYRRKIEEI